MYIFSLVINEEKKMDGNCIMCCTVWVLSCTARHEVHKNFECITSVWRFCWFIFYWQHSKFSNLNWSSSTERKAILVVCYVRKIMPPAFGQYSFHCQIAWHFPMFLYACGEIILIIILCIKFNFEFMGNGIKVQPKCKIISMKFQEIVCVRIRKRMQYKYT